MKEKFKDYHVFWSEKGWDPTNDVDCPHNGGGVSDRQCCGTATTPNVLYNAATKKCCPDGNVINAGDIC